MMGSCLDIASRPPPNVAMVPRLRVAVRVVSEDEYLTHLAKGPPGPSLYRGEKKFPIIIPNPQQWQIGHVAAEVKRQFKQLYGRDVGTILYLSHGFDDCQLHKDLSVYEHLYDEGRARTDPGDQYVVVKAVFSQGRPLREGSVVPDFDDPIYENRPIPPVPIPSWPGPSSKSGKRPAEEYGNQYSGANNFPDVKRQRLSDLDDADSDDNIAQSFERDGPMQGVESVLPTSQTVIHDSQLSPRDELFRSIRQPSWPENGPVSFQLSHTSTSTRDFSPIRRPKADQISESSADLPFSTSRKPLLYDPNHGKTQALLTPPSDASKKNLIGETEPFLVHGPKRKFSPAQATSSGLRRPGTVRKGIYNMEESEDIECSAMSPNSKLATRKKLSRSSSGSKGSSKGSRVRKEKGSPDRFQGSVPNSEVVKLMEDGGVIQPDSSKRPRKDISYDTPEYNFTADEDGYSQQGHALQARNTSAATWHLPGERVSHVQSKEQLASPITTLSLPKNNGSAKTIPNNHFDDVDQEENAAASLPLNVTTHEHGVDPEQDASVAPEETSVSKRNNPTLSVQSCAVPAAIKQVEQTSPQARHRRRCKRSRAEDHEATKPHNIDTAHPRLDTKQSTPVDSPGEQLLEMQASSQKSRQDSQTKDLKKTKKRARIEHERQEIAAGTPKMSAADRQERQPQKPRWDRKAQAAKVPPGVDMKATEKRAGSDTAPRSPYARPSQPEGSIGLGFTNSPRRPSTVNGSLSSLSPRKLFQDKPASTEMVKSDALKDTESSSGSSDESSDENSDSAVATPLKQAPADEAQTPYRKFIARPKPIVEPQEAMQEAMQEATANFKVTTEPALRPESPVLAFVTLPKGMTLEQYEAKKLQFKDVPPKTKAPTDPKVNKELKAQAERALLARTSSKGSTSSVAPSEQPQAKIMPKKSAAAGEVAVPGNGSITSGQANKKPEGTSQKKAVRPAAKPTGRPSTTASESSKASQPARTGTIQEAVAAKVKVTTSTAPEPGTLLKHLKHRVAGRSARSSPAPPTFTPAPKQIAKGFDALDEDSDDDSDSESDEDDDDDVEENRVNAIKAAKPGQSTRSSVADSDEDMDDDSEEDDED